MTTDTLAATPDTIIRNSDPSQPDATSESSATPSRSDFDKMILSDTRSGMSQRQIAAKYKLSLGWIQRSLARSIKQFAAEHRIKLTGSTREDISKKLFELCPSAVDKTSSLMQHATKEEVQLKAASDILDRAGFSPVHKSVQLSVIEEMSKDELVTEIRRIIQTGLTSLVERTASTNITPASDQPAPAQPTNSTPL